MPTSAVVHGDYVSVPDLHGRLVILDKSNTIIAGPRPQTRDPAKRANYNVPQDKWIEGDLQRGPTAHPGTRTEICTSRTGTSLGRIMKLVRGQVVDAVPLRRGRTSGAAPFPPRLLARSHPLLSLQTS